MHSFLIWGLRCTEVPFAAFDSVKGNFVVCKYCLWSWATCFIVNAFNYHKKPQLCNSIFEPPQVLLVLPLIDSILFYFNEQFLIVTKLGGNWYCHLMSYLTTHLYIDEYIHSLYRVESCWKVSAVFALCSNCFILLKAFEKLSLCTVSADSQWFLNYCLL